MKDLFLLPYLKKRLDCESSLAQMSPFDVAGDPDAFSQINVTILQLATKKI